MLRRFFDLCFSRCHSSRRDDLADRTAPTVSPTARQEPTTLDDQTQRASRNNRTYAWSDVRQLQLPGARTTSVHDIAATVIRTGH